jgi:hypothetical protein
MRRVTGAPTTSGENTIVNMMALFLAGHGDDPFSPAAWTVTGLNCKIQIHHDVDSLDLTFLRGVWLPFSDGFRHWTPMPSQVCKLCKVIRTDTTDRALLQYAHGIARGYEAVPRSMPILGAFVACLLRCGRPGKDVPLEEHKIAVGGIDAELCRSQAEEWFCERYDVSVAEIRDCERILDRITSLPYYVGHKVMSHLARDYGTPTMSDI